MIGVYACVHVSAFELELSPTNFEVQWNDFIFLRLKWKTKMTWDRILNLPKETNGHDFHFCLEIDFNMIKNYVSLAQNSTLFTMGTYM